MITFDDYMASLPKERQKAIEEEAKKLLLEIEQQRSVSKQNDDIS